MRRSCLVTLLLLMALAPPVAAQEYAGAEATLKCPGTVRAGATITIDGSGFAPSSLVRVVFDARLGLPAVDVIADLDGKISLPVTIPQATAEGTYDISASGRGRDGGKLKLKCSIKVKVDTAVIDGVVAGFERPADAGRRSHWPTLAGTITVLGLLVAVVLGRRRPASRRPQP